ncbi:MAG: alpha/beta hydrolase fold domain-containing protein, partial [Actinobacteria bacterium]|nr:alpha/beta hydrolase fold domain-containing protein [Actinomycetota bacterium]
RAAHTNDSEDALLSALSLSVPALGGFARDGMLDPAWSPVNHDFTGMPPVFIQVGGQEVLRSDAEQLAERCADAGVPCTVQVWDKAIHVFHFGADILPEARTAIAHLAGFIRTAVDDGVPSTLRRVAAA